MHLVYNQGTNWSEIQRNKEIHWRGGEWGEKQKQVSAPLCQLVLSPPILLIHGKSLIAKRSNDKVRDLS